MKKYPSRLLVFRSTGFIDVPEKKRLLKDWYIVRFTRLPYPDEPNVLNHSLRKKLPVPDGTFESVYCYHVTEHLTIEENLFFLREMARVLKPNGILRVSTPDLHQLAEEYLSRYRAYSESNTPDRRVAYEWSVISLLDQMVRRKSGGRMADDFLQGRYDRQQEKELHGDALCDIFEAGRGLDPDTGWKKNYLDGRPAPYGFWLRKMLWAAVRKITLKAGSPLQWWQENEVWIYDRLSLRDLMQQAGLRDVRPTDYKTSRISDWSVYDFDRSVHGDHAYEPSVFMEGER